LPQVSAVSASWSYGYASNTVTIVNEESQLAQFVAQGKVFFASSGDAGQAPGYGPSYPAASDWFTSVGGTTVHAVSPSGGSPADTAWLFSGGGPSPWAAMPSWQSAFIGSDQVAANTRERAVPDVVAVADPLHSPVATYFKQRWTLEGGTSVGAPAWAGIAALLGQQLADNGTSLAARVAAAPGGFNALLYRSNLLAGADPALQPLAGGTTFFQGTTCATCSVVPGYNDVAGLGTPDVAQLVLGF
jgi:subtilase family serine protease